MEIDTALLKALNQPGVHSGTQLGEQLGMSRVAVQKRLAALRQTGLPLESVPRSGYRLAEGVHLLDAEAIQAQLDDSTRAKLEGVEVHRQLDSTNSWMQQQSLMANRALVCLAENQTAGRGRRGAGWQATPYRNILFSLGWRFPNWPESLSALSPVVGLVVCQVLELLGVEDVRIKWPNDIYYHNAKLAGTLVQAGGEAAGHCDVIIGLGLNVHLDPADIEHIDQDCIDLSDLAGGVDRNRLAALLIAGFVEILPLFAERGFEPFRAAWEARSLYLGQSVRIIHEGREESGVMEGVDERGALLFRSGTGALRRFTEAEISLRPINS